MGRRKKTKRKSSYVPRPATAENLSCKVGEEWKLVEGTEDYFISNLGRFRHGRKLMKIAIATTGYATCNIGHRRAKVHRLVAQAFVENPDPDTRKLVDHIDGNKLNNNASNLRWVTHSENTQAAYDTGLIKNVGQRLKVLVIDENDNATLYDTQAEAGRVLGCDAKSIYNVIIGEWKQWKGYRFMRIRSFTDLSEKKVESNDA